MICVVMLNDGQCQVKFGVQMKRFIMNIIKYEERSIIATPDIPFAPQIQATRGIDVVDKEADISNVKDKNFQMKSRMKDISICK